MTELAEQTRANPSSSPINQSASNVNNVSKDHSRHSPVTPLAPLEFLQNQRRGSITDPSLHAANPNPSPLSAQNLRQSGPVFRHQPEPSVTPIGASQDPLFKNSSSEPRPASPYVFGDATSHSSDGQQLRKLLRSPSAELDSSRREESSASHATGSRNSSGPSGCEGARLTSQVDKMMIDENKLDTQSSSNNSARNLLREPHQFDYNMRRHSIAVGQETHTHAAGLQSGSVLQGTKRKMSIDRGVFPPVGEEIDPQLVGPGVPSVMDMDADAPAPKRRGSAIDTQRIEQLSLYDRRNSVDSRGPTQWWANDRRDATGAPILASPSSIGGYNPGFPGADLPHGRPPTGIATFAWPANHPPDHAGPIPMTNEGNTNMVGPHRTFDPGNSPLGMMPPMNFIPDRRMSVPDNLTNAPVGPTRVLRSRSRPPSRMRSGDTVGAQATPSSGQEGESSTTPPTTAATAKKESGSTPYSRSPELRISHKLAERKRRKEMKDLFDELRDQLPADRGMKASKWEILSKAIDFVAQLKQSHQEMAREIDMLRHELDAVRQGLPPPFPPSGPPHTMVYTQGPPPVPGQYPPPPPGAVAQHPPPQTHPQLPPPPASRPGSSNSFPPGGPSAPSAQNGTLPRVEAPPP